MPQRACERTQQIKPLHNEQLCVVLLRLLMRLTAPPLSYSNETKVNQTEPDRAGPAESGTLGALLPPAVRKQQQQQQLRRTDGWFKAPTGCMKWSPAELTACCGYMLTLTEKNCCYFIKLENNETGLNM